MNGNDMEKKQEHKKKQETKKVLIQTKTDGDEA